MCFVAVRIQVTFDQCNDNRSSTGLCEGEGSNGCCKQWEVVDIVAAMEAVEDEKPSVAPAAVRFKVPRKTLEDRIKGRVKHGTLPGPKTVLTAEEEDAPVAYLV